MNVIFDIETMALPLAEVEQFKPEFSPDSRLKDAEKIKANLTEKLEGWLDKLALNAHTARILALGYAESDSTVGLTEINYTILHDIPEQEMLEKFWDLFRKFGAFPFVGHNSLDFDVPFIIRRSYILGIDVPFETMEGRYLSRRFVDTMRMWGCGTGEMISLDMLSKILGVGKKLGSGKDFAKLYNNPATRDEALAYLRNDLQLTHACYERMVTK